MSHEKEKFSPELKTIQMIKDGKSGRDFTKEVMKVPGGEKILNCIQCGSCAGGCPAMFVMDYSPMQIIKMINLGMKEIVLSSKTIWVCPACHTCSTRCPRNVDFPTLMMSLRNIAIRENLVKNSTKLNFHKSFFEVVNKYGRLNESKFYAKFFDIRNFSSLLYTLRLGFRLLKRGKIKLRASKVETTWISSLLEKINQEDSQ